MADDRETVTRTHWALDNSYILAAFIVAMAVTAYLFVVLSTAKQSNPFVDRGPFAGCYYAANADPITLGPDGRVLLGSRPIGTYAIRRPVPGKHGYLLQLEATGFAEVNGRLVLNPQGRAQILDITPAGVIRVYAGGGETKFRKGECSDARDR